MVQMRTIRQAIEQIRQTDPDTAISFNSLRLAVLNGEIPSVKVGNRFLVSMDNVYSYYSGKE